MNRQRRALTAVLAVLAIVALLPVPCTCAPKQPPVRAAGHDCCAPPTGIRAVDRGCCDTAPSLDVAPNAPVPAAAAPAVVAIVRPASLADPVIVPGRPLAAAVSPPPLVLRI